VTPLTGREREVAELAASGLTSAEIGRRLYLSTRTVDSHLGRVYTKLAVANRTELAAVTLAGRRVPAQLPAGVPTFVGRPEPLRRLDYLLTHASDDGPVVCAVTGTAGVGKPVAEI